MKNLKYFIPAVAILGGLVFAATTFAATYFSNPSAATASATSTLIYQTPGTATSTVIYDSFGQNGDNQNSNNTGNTFAVDSAALVVQFSASSSAGSQVNINLEYSEDKIDWYQGSPATFLNGYGTTTLPVSLQQIPQYQWKFASSTIGGAAISTSTIRDTRIILTKPLMRYERAVISCAQGGFNCAVWAKWIPEKTTP